jgi:hypothetical protein
MWEKFWNYSRPWKHKLQQTVSKYIQWWDFLIAVVNFRVLLQRWISSWVPTDPGAHCVSNNIKTERNTEQRIFSFGRTEVRLIYGVFDYVGSISRDPCHCPFCDTRVLYRSFLTKHRASVHSWLCPCVAQEIRRGPELQGPVVHKGKNQEVWNMRDDFHPEKLYSTSHNVYCHRFGVDNLDQCLYRAFNFCISFCDASVMYQNFLFWYGECFCLLTLSQSK